MRLVTKKVPYIVDNGIIQFIVWREEQVLQENTSKRILKVLKKAFVFYSIVNIIIAIIALSIGAYKSPIASIFLGINIGAAIAAISHGFFDEFYVKNSIK